MPQALHILVNLPLTASAMSRTRIDALELQVEEFAQALAELRVSEENRLREFRKRGPNTLIGAFLLGFIFARLSYKLGLFRRLA